MELRHLRYFVALAEELHFGRAARRLSITQPPLSSSIRALEDELGAKLFERDSKQVVLTAVGKAFLAEAQPILEQVRIASESARAIASGKRGYLEIGFAGSTVYRDMPQIVSTYLKRHGGVEVSLTEMSSVEQCDAILRGHLHAGFFNGLSTPEGLASVPLADDHFVCCLPEPHRLADEAEIELAWLAREPFVTFSRDAAPSNYDNIISLCTQAGFHPLTRYAARQWLTVVALVASGLGVALVPGCVARAGVKGARFVPLKGTAVRNGAFFAWNPERLMPALQAFIDTVTAVSSGAVEPSGPA